MKKLSAEELANKDGRESSEAYVCVDGTVYNVSESKKWTGGVHMRRHNAGSDLTNELKAAPHGKEVLERFEVVGTCECESKPEYTGARASVESFLERFPFFRRHPHPAVVHFPVGLGAVAPVFLIIGILLDSPATQWAAFCCVAGVLVTMPAVLASGYFAWWINYECVDSSILKKKRVLGWTAFAINIGLVGARVLVTEPLQITKGYGLVYVIGVFVLGAILSYVGFLGGKLTFPYE
jgi:predicted heme/steroid binding protein/uncharacterized membrane protein